VVAWARRLQPSLLVRCRQESRFPAGEQRADRCVRSRPLEYQRHLGIPLGRLASGVRSVALDWARPYSRSAEWTPLGRYELPRGRNGNRWLWLRSEIPLTADKDPVLHFFHLDQEFQVFVEGKLVYEWGDFSSGTAELSGLSQSRGASAVGLCGSAADAAHLF
jgi:hypothetical protein